VVEAHPTDGELSIPRKDALLVLAVHSYIPSQANPRTELVEAVLQSLQGRDVAITFSMPKSYFEKAVKIMGLEKLAGKYGARILPPHQHADYKLELETLRGTKISVRALRAAFDESLAEDRISPSR
jgi:hypothetical protein